MTLIGIFAVLCIFIACLGLFGSRRVRNGATHA